MQGMGFFYTPLPLWLTVGSWIIAVGLIAFVIMQRAFSRLQDATLQNVWFGTIVTVTVLWACNAWFDDGPVIHLLGATLMVTLFDWRLALLGTAATTGLAAVVLDANWLNVALTYVLFGALPVGVSTLLQRLSNAWLPRNLFTFILGHGFVTSGAAVAAACGGTLLMEMALAGGPIAIPAAFMRGSVLLCAGEALFTGLLTILITVYKPAWIMTYDVRRYRLDRGPRV
ncbi:INTEGRAL MEMBRANE PROTEIN (Rhomboid family) [Candidatus Burkholderia verschuerenii]|uniref:INTEGRAL MEMBRANE PROTEIN (Rhomboid family) n=2 Tax=Candidatus Burkholderia verschuerenii TaxID=242163 RepID=A0A0L0MGH2_9BURK|nr:INTEGRAL MEMBRANE PROTEIN (Rhomboid family) [Candidatus Burkholderia verschuerenii]